MDRAVVRWLILVVGIALVSIVILTFGPLPEWILRNSHKNYTSLKLIDQLDAEKDVRASLLQAVGGLLLVVGAFTAWRQLVATTGQLALNQAIRVTNTFTSGLEQLGAKDSLARRVGGIYALDRVAHEEPAEVDRVVDVLAAFIRQQPPHLMDHVPADIQAAIDVLLVRRGSRAISLDEARLRGVNLAGKDLHKISMRGVVLVGADLHNANLIGTDLTGADLSSANLRDANLTGAKLSEVNIRNADLAGANLSGTELFGTPIGQSR